MKNQVSITVKDKNNSFTIKEEKPIILHIYKKYEDGEVVREDFVALSRINIGSKACFFQIHFHEDVIMKTLRGLGRTDSEIYEEAKKVVDACIMSEKEKNFDYVKYVVKAFKKSNNPDFHLLTQFLYLAIGKLNAKIENTYLDGVIIDYIFELQKTIKD
jgi:hypothetical protein